VQTTFGGGVVGAALSPAYAVGQRLYASVNGLLTNRWQDSYETQWIDLFALGSGLAGAPIEPDVTRMGTVLSPPDATSAEMFLELNF
jgi:glycerol uptake facilitator-like aquaporin